MALSARSLSQGVAAPRHSMRYVSVHSRRAPALRVANVDEATFAKEVLQADKPVLVDFWAAWCGPCKLVAPLMDATEKEHGSSIKVVKVEHDKNPALIEKYKVYGLPTLILFKGGEPIEGSKREGAINKAMLVDYLKKYSVI